jgi:hypothetical protein
MVRNCIHVVKLAKQKHD